VWIYFESSVGRVSVIVCDRRSYGFVAANHTGRQTYEQSSSILARCVINRSTATYQNFLTESRADGHHGGKLGRSRRRDGRYVSAAACVVSLASAASRLITAGVLQAPARHYYQRGSARQ